MDRETFRAFMSDDEAVSRAATVIGQGDNRSMARALLTAFYKEVGNIPDEYKLTDYFEQRESFCKAIAVMVHVFHMAGRAAGVPEPTGDPDRFLDAAKVMRGQVRRQRPQ